MQSRQPKVLHLCAGLPLLGHAVRAAHASGCAPIVVVVSPQHAEAVEASLRAQLPTAELSFTPQLEPRGTGDAARAGMGVLGNFAGRVLILCGDAPLLTSATLGRLQASQAPFSLLTARLAAPFGYGRILRAATGGVLAVVEERDATPAQRAIQEVNAGVYCVEAGLLRRALAALTPNNAQNELYLTDIVAQAAATGAVEGQTVADADEIRGVNSRAELVEAERLMMRRLLAAHAAAGVTVRDPAGTHIDALVTCEVDVELGVGVQLYGRTHLASGARVDGPSVLIDSHVGPGAWVRSFSHLQGAHLEATAVAGPFARLRPEAHLCEGAQVGNFVELKKTRLGARAKANHLAYLGDADIGAGANLGAGSITCNYDGVTKHRTRVGAGAFVGSNATLVAPLSLGDGSFVAAGSVITGDVPAAGLAFGRARQTNREGGATQLRARLAAQVVAPQFPDGKKRKT